MGGVHRKCLNPNHGAAPAGAFEEVMYSTKVEHFKEKTELTMGADNAILERALTQIDSMLTKQGGKDKSELPGMISDSSREDHKIAGYVNEDTFKRIDRVVSNATTMAPEEPLDQESDSQSDCSELPPPVAPAAPVRACSKQDTGWGAGFDIDFNVDGEIKTVTITSKPLGLIFDPTTKPVQIKSVKEGGQAEKLGVQAGWKMKAIAGKDASSLCAEDIMSTVASHTGCLPNTCDIVKVVFVADGQEKSQTFPRRRLGELGMRFAQSDCEHIMVADVRPMSKADILGVQAGWLVKEVGGKDLTQMEFWVAWDVFEFAVAPDSKADNFSSFMRRMTADPIGKEMGVY
jgi:hypothetical protein